MKSDKAFCLGFSKTGTTSMEVAFETLGYRVCKGHWQNNHTFYMLALYIHRDYDELLRMTRYWDAFADGPWGGTELYFKLLERYPTAKYILTERDPERWYASFEKLITMFDLDLDTALSSYHARGMYGSGYYFESLFGIDRLSGNKEKIISAYTAHNEKVKADFAKRKKELLVIDLAENRGWERICEFLGEAVPDVEFPHTNRAEDNPYLSNSMKA